MNKIAKYVAIIFAAIIVVLLAILIFVPAKKTSAPVIFVAHPSQTVMSSPDGSISIFSPEANARIFSPVVASGTIIGGNWFFEASFPVKVLDGDGTVLGQGPAQAQGDWMTTGTVPFSVTLSF